MQYTLVKIFDRNKDGGLIPISFLIRAIFEKAPNFFEGKWKLMKCSYGYGEQICNIEEYLTKFPFKEIDGTELAELLIQDKKGYFYNADFQNLDLPYAIGIFDSTYLYCIITSSFVPHLEGCFKEIVLEKANAKI
jgi:hypothetical protein